MFDIDVDVPRPGQTMALLGLVAFAIIAAAPDGRASVLQEGIAAPATNVVESPPDPQEVMDRQESILRDQLDALRAEADATGDPRIEAAIADATERLKAILHDKRAREAALLQSISQQWSAQDTAVAASRTFFYGTTKAVKSDGKFAMWPVLALKGISAGFRDGAYAQRFGVRHDGLDIPTPQGTPLKAVDDATVIVATDNGYGFSSITLQTTEGVSVLYGHVSKIFVQEGDHVSAGDIIGESGGRPGTKGAGLLTTGAHLHLEVIVDGVHQDPLNYLPPLDQMNADQNTIKSDQQPAFWRNGQRIY